MWISSVTGISKVLCTSEVACATRIWLVRMLNVLRLGRDFLWCVPSWRIENPWFLLAITASQWRNVLFDPCFIEARTRVLCFFDGIFLDFWCTRWLIYSMELSWNKRTCSFCKPLLKIELMLYVECVTFTLCSLTLVECSRMSRTM